MNFIYVIYIVFKEPPPNVQPERVVIYIIIYNVGTL